MFSPSSGEGADGSGCVRHSELGMVKIRGGV